MYRGRITRVRMDAEGSTVTDCERALDDGFGVVFHALVRALEAGGLRTDDGPLVFTRESRFGEAVFESKVREDDGAIYYAGRRVVTFHLPDDPLTIESRSADDLLNELRTWPNVGISITPLIQRMPLDPAWRISVTQTEHALGDEIQTEWVFDEEALTLKDAAMSALSRLRANPVVSSYVTDPSGVRLREL